MDFNFLPAWPPVITPIMAFGLMLIIGTMGGFLAHRVNWLPSITGFLLVGYLCGPDVLGLLRENAIYEAHVFVDVALALILYRLGLSLDLKMLRKQFGLVAISLLESAATFVLVTLILYAFDIPLLISAMVGAITISSSPAVLLHVAHETGAKGEVTDSSQTLVALNNCLSFMIFSAILPFAHLSSGSGLMTIVWQPIYTLGGSILLGAVMALVLHQAAIHTQRAAQYRLALVIGTVLVTLGLALQLKLSSLLAPLVIGVLVKSMERRHLVSKLEFGPSFELFFIVLFVFAGAGLHIHDLLEYLPAVIALVLARLMAKTVFVALLSKLYHRSFRTGIARGLLLAPMAGLAIGLVKTSGSLFPEYASLISAIVLGAVAVFETLGPPLASFAFRLAKETDETRGEATTAQEAKTKPDKNDTDETMPEDVPPSNAAAAAAVPAEALPSKI